MNSHRKIKIIYIHEHTPSYEYYRDLPRPRINWDTPDGNWVGVWGYDWGDQLGNSILDQFPELEFEVWQPDLRADRVYCHTFENGLRHKIFPAVIQQIAHRPTPVSARMVEQLYLERKDRTRAIILQANVKATLGWIIEPHKDLKIIGTLHETIMLPHNQLFKLRKRLLRYFYLMQEHFSLRKLIRHYDLITYQNDRNLESLQWLYPGPLVKITMGIDFEQFKPMERAHCRQELGLPLDRKIFLTVSRLNSLKQIDKVIKTFIKLDDRFDFLLIIMGSKGQWVGDGQPDYFDYLKRLASPLSRGNKVLFTGFKTGGELVKYYNAADLFIQASQMEGGPVVSMEAIACNIPVMTTDTGYIAELLKQYGKGRIVGTRHYQEWEAVLQAYLNGTLSIPVFDRDVARNDFSWQAIARKFHTAYQRVLLTGDEPVAYPSLATEGQGR